MVGLLDFLNVPDGLNPYLRGYGVQGPQAAAPAAPVAPAAPQESGGFSLPEFNPTGPQGLMGMLNGYGLEQSKPAPFGLLSGQPIGLPQTFQPNPVVNGDAGLQPPTQAWNGSDLSALNASPAGPAMTPMPPQRPAGLGFNDPSKAQGEAPMQLPGARPPVPVGGQDMPGMPQKPAAPVQAGKDEPGFLSKLGTVAGSIYGQGGPGDSLIALGAGLMSGPNAGSGLLKGMAMVNANALTAKKKEDEEKKAKGQIMLAQHIAAQSGGRISPDAALGIIQSGNAGQFLTDQFRSPTSEQEYNIYKNSETTAGRTPLTFDQWYTRNKQIESGVGETAFERGAAEKAVGRYDKMVESGSQARASMVDIAQMREISGRFGSQGAAADIKARIGPMAQALGIDIKDLSDIQAFNSVIQRVAPTLREPGSGSTSDIEFKGMLNALPQLSSNPAARTAILDTMEAMARDKQARGEIAAKILNKEIPRAEGDRMLRELPDPMTGFKAFKEQNPSLFSGQPQASGGAPQAGNSGYAEGTVITNPQTKARKVMRNGQWVDL